MKSLFFPGVLLLISLSVFAGHEDHNCSRHRFFQSAEVPTHVKDSALLLYDVSHYAISLEVTDSSTFIKGYTEITARAINNISELKFELRNSMSIDSVFLDGARTENYMHQSDLVNIDPGTVIPAGNLFSARIYYKGSGGQGGFFSGISNRKDAQTGKYVTYTLSEPFAARDWYACKQVLHDKADSADIWLTVGEGLMAGSNGLLQGIDSLENDRLRFRWKTRYPVAYYLLSLSVSEYQDYSFLYKTRQQSGFNPGPELYLRYPRFL